MDGSGKILITGAAGFVGVALCRQLQQQGYDLRVLLRPGGSRLPGDLALELDDIVEAGELTCESVWMDLLAGVTAVVHLAARAHCCDQSAAGDLYFHDNLDITVALARAARRSEVRQFIYLSSIKVNGKGVLQADHEPYKVSDIPRPDGAYAVSKWRAEQELEALFGGDESAPRLTIIRPPLIYGDRAKGNYALLQKWLRWGLPVPVPRAGNHRSLLALASLIEVITALLDENGRNSERLLLLCDHREWSTELLIDHLAQKTGRPVRRLALPGALLKGLAKIIPREDFLVKFFGSLRIKSNL